MLTMRDKCIRNTDLWTVNCPHIVKIFTCSRQQMWEMKIVLINYVLIFEGLCYIWCVKRDTGTSFKANRRRISHREPRDFFGWYFWVSSHPRALNVWKVDCTFMTKPKLSQLCMILQLFRGYKGRQYENYFYRTTNHVLSSFSPYCMNKHLTFQSSSN